MRIRFFILFALLLTLSGSLYYSLVFSTRPLTPDKAYFFLLNKEVPAARQALCALPAHRLTLPLNLYLGYLELVSEHFEQASAYFNSLLSTPSTQKQDVEMRSLLGLALGAYLTQHEEEALIFIEKAKQTGPPHPSFLFFDALEHYFHKQYKEASHLWLTYGSAQYLYHNDWMIAVLHEFYPPCSTRVHLAHCLIERGDIKAGRALLEKEQHQLDNPEHPAHQLATLFLGLSYLKEANSLPLAERASYYQLAHFYFRKTTSLDLYSHEKQRVLDHLNQELTALLGSSLSTLSQPWCLALVHLLQDWQGTPSIEPLANLIAQRLIYEAPENQKKLLKLLKEEFQGTSLCGSLCEAFITHFEQAIYSECLPSFCHLWETLSEIYSISDVKVQHLAEGIYEHLLKIIYRDDTHLSSTQRLVELYLLLAPQNHDRLASALLQQALQLWGHVGQEEKGLFLMDFVLTMSNHQDEVARQIEFFLKDLFTKAEENNLLPRLALIHDALTHFQININEAAFMNHAKIVNHLADATSLYEARNYLAAQTHTAWVLKIDPSNICAQRLMGLICFQLGNYEKAIELLHNFSKPDLYVQQALAFAYAYTQQKQKEHIAQINGLDSFNEDD